MFQKVLSFLLLASFAMAEELVTVQSNAWKFGTGGGIIGFIVLILDIIVFSKSGRATVGNCKKPY